MLAEAVERPELVGSRARSPSAGARRRVDSYLVGAERLGELVEKAMVAGKKPWWTTGSRTGNWSCAGRGCSSEVPGRKTLRVRWWNELVLFWSRQVAMRQPFCEYRVFICEDVRDGFRQPWGSGAILK